MWWQFKKVHPSIKLHLCHSVDIQLFVRVDRYKKSTNVCLQGGKDAHRWETLFHHRNGSSQRRSQVHQDIIQEQLGEMVQRLLWEKKKPTTPPHTPPHPQAWLFQTNTNFFTLNWVGFWSWTATASFEPSFSYTRSWYLMMLMGSFFPT